MNAQTDIVCIKLPPTLDLAAAEGLLDMLRRELDAHPRLGIDAADVATLTVPCIQIIVAALQSDQISIEQPSAAFVAAFEDLGFDVAQLCAAPSIVPEQQTANSETAVDAAPAIVPDQQAAMAEAAVGTASAAAPDQQSTNSDAVSSADCVIVPAEEQAMTKRILTIDDSKTIRDMLRFTLADAGFEVFQAVDGQDGLDVLGKQQVDVVITDINMPKMDGYEVIRRMRSDSAYKSMPILVLTTESEADKRDMARLAGATGWMVKPFDPDRLIATINKVAP
jgi:two-component system, chemotaxis family, chemotaxis protein CheY